MGKRMADNTSKPSAPQGDKGAPAGENNGERTLGKDFIRQKVDADLASGKYDKVVTRFPPEPNGYLHIGHTKAIALSFGLAEEYGGVTHLRFDDTNPLTEDTSYVDSIKEDIHWMGFDWGDRLHYASDYFERLYDWAVKLIRKGVAYVCHLTEEEIREYRGTVKEAGKPSPYRERSVEENLAEFEKMRRGEYKDGEATLRAKIDMANPNMKMRDPLMYRVRHAHHHNTGDKWCIYPMYDWAHGQSDAIEGITHSLCTLEFENNNELYRWFLEQLEVPTPPEQTEFARLALNYTVMSKRKLLELIEKKLVNGWNDPRIPTLSGLRRRGYTPAAIRAFVERVGVSKANSVVDLGMLEWAIREDLNYNAPRRMAVLDPLKVTITNYPEGQSEELDAVNNPEQPEAGTRKVPFGRTMFIERDDFMEDPPRKFFRLAPGREVRLRYAYFITCDEVVKDAEGNVTELNCTYDPATRGGDAPDGRKVKATLHWVSAEHAVNLEVRNYDRLFAVENPLAQKYKDNWLQALNPDSLEVLTHVKGEPSLAEMQPGDSCQFERKGYYCMDPDSSDGAPVFNRTVTLRDSWAKMQKKG
ncbi:glutamine--tRNA ligase/YqeY domain fusion protein [bacterium]|nr:glutamine--tRNA ligase/YqeY domain fusion protein [bacterium]